MLCLCCGDLFRLNLRFFDAIRIPDTNAYVINILCAFPAAYEPSVVQPDVTTDTAPSETGEEQEEEEEEEGEEETAAGAHTDGRQLRRE